MIVKNYNTHWDHYEKTKVAKKCCTNDTGSI